MLATERDVAAPSTAVVTRRPAASTGSRTKQGVFAPSVEVARNCSTMPVRASNREGVALI